MKKSRLLFLVTFGLILALAVLLSGATPALAIAPTVTWATPDQGDQGQSLSVTIAGTNFTGTTSVSFGSDITINSFTVDSATRITVDITVDNLATVGARDISVTNIDGTGTLNNAFAVLALPTIDSVNPSYGVQGQTLDVVITGTNLLGVTGASFGIETTVNSITIDSDTQITVNISISSSSPIVARNVNVINPAGTGIKVDGFTVLGMPTISEVSPSQSPQGQTMNVIITGTHLSETISVSFGYGVNVNGFAVDNATQITANVTVSASATPGYRDVSVTTLGATATKAQCFGVFVSPTIGSVSPSQGIQGQTLSFIITGTHFIGATSVDLESGITVTSLNVESDTQARVTITISDTTTPGARDVSVTTPGGTATKADGFTVLSRPAISSVSPSQGIQGQTLDVTIAGDYFVGARSVSFGPGITVNDFTVNSSTQIAANITIGINATIGERSISISTPVATGTLADGFAVVIPSPVIAELTPASGRQGDKLEVIITGSNFTGATGVSLGEGVTVDSFTVDSATQITAQITIDANATPGTRDVLVTTSEASGTMADAFEIESGASGVPMYFWMLAGGIAGAGLLVLAFVIRRKRAAAH